MNWLMNILTTTWNVEVMLKAAATEAEKKNYSLQTGSNVHQTQVFLLNVHRE